MRVWQQAVARWLHLTPEASGGIHGAGAVVVQATARRELGSDAGIVGGEAARQCTVEVGIRERDCANSLSQQSERHARRISGISGSIIAP